MTNDDEKRQLELELLAADLKLRRKQEFWETPRNIAILVGVVAAIAAAIGFWFGRRFTPPMPPLTPVFGRGASDPMSAGQFMDAVQTAGIFVIAAMLVYVVVRLDRTLTVASREIKSALTTQLGLAQVIERALRRLETIEQRVEERNAILPTDKLGQTLDELRGRLDRLENKDEIR
jgi:hypothetical protein